MIVVFFGGSATLKHGNKDELPFTQVCYLVKFILFNLFLKENLFSQ